MIHSLFGWFLYILIFRLPIIAFLLNVYFQIFPPDKTLTILLYKSNNRMAYVIFSLKVLFVILQRK